MLNFGKYKGRERKETIFHAKNKAATACNNFKLNIAQEQVIHLKMASLYG